MIRKRIVLSNLLFALAAFVGAAPFGARALAQDCVLDKCLGQKSAPRVDSRMRSAVPPGDFDYYVLALSWSPGFCALARGSRDRDQCEPGARLGFVVHGLWPQRDGELIADCQAGLRPPSRLDMSAARDLFPTESLARYEWRKHGGCTGLAPSAYFADVQRARASVTVPASLTEAREAARTAPEDILRSFREANPRLRPGMAAVSCPKGVLQEVRICLSKDLRDFTPCPDVVSRSCRARQIETPPPL
jgi:ribonuclease T2